MSTEKINQALGIESIDSFLSSLNVDDEKIRQLDDIDTQVRGDVEKIDKQIQNFKESGIQGVNLDDIDSSLRHINELIEISKDTIRFVYNQLTDSELVDSELVSSFSKLLEAVHIQIQEYISLYKDRQSFYYKVKLAAINHSNKLEQIRLKHNLDLEKIEKIREKGDSVDVDNRYTYSQEDLISELDKMEQSL